MKELDADIPAEYFENSENREIFNSWRQAEDVESLKESLDSVLQEHLEDLINRNVLATEINERYNRYILRLREDYLRSLARKRATTLETDGSAKELPGEKDTEIVDGLREVFSQKARRGAGKGEKK